MRNGNRQIMNLQLPVFAEVPGQRASILHIVLVAFVGGILMAVNRKNSVFFMTTRQYWKPYPFRLTTTSRRVSSMMPVRTF